MKYTKLEKLKRWIIGDMKIAISPQPVIVDEEPLTSYEFREYLVTCKKMEERITRLAEHSCEERKKGFYGLESVLLCEDIFTISIKAEGFEIMVESFPIYALWDDDFKARKEREKIEKDTAYRRAEYERLKEEFGE